jgi:hypothetical protein
MAGVRVLRAARGGRLQTYEAGWHPRHLEALKAIVEGSAERE